MELYCTNSYRPWRNEFVLSTDNKNNTCEWNLKKKRKISNINNSRKFHEEVRKIIYNDKYRIPAFIILFFLTLIMSQTILFIRDTRCNRQSKRNGIKYPRTGSSWRRIRTTWFRHGGTIATFALHLIQSIFVAEKNYTHIPIQISCPISKNG